MSRDTAHAPAPFDHPKADLILRSSDKIDFRIFKLFLSLASPSFEAFLDDPRIAEVNKDQADRDGLVVIPMMEDSKTLDVLLRFCYPCSLVADPKIEVLKEVVDILEAARKYSLTPIEKKVRQAISSRKVLKTEPIRSFAVAHRGRLREETLLAARYTLAQPLIPLWCQEIELLTATNLLSLITYHKRCGDAVYALRLSHLPADQKDEDQPKKKGKKGGGNTGSKKKGKTGGSSTIRVNCGCPRSSLSDSETFATRGFKLSAFNASLQWWEDFMEEIFIALRDKPSKETVEAYAEKTVQSVKAKHCPFCSPRIAKSMSDFVEEFAGKLDVAVSQVELQLEF